MVTIEQNRTIAMLSSKNKKRFVEMQLSSPEKYERALSGSEVSKKVDVEALSTKAKSVVDSISGENNLNSQ